MTDQLSGPELWLAAAKVMGLHIYNNTPWVEYGAFQEKSRRFDPPNNPTDAWAMHQYVRGQGYDVKYTALSFPEDWVRVELEADEGTEFDCKADGPDDETAIGRAIVEMGAVEALDDD